MEWVLLAGIFFALIYFGLIVIVIACAKWEPEHNAYMVDLTASGRVTEGKGTP